MNPEIAEQAARQSTSGQAVRVIPERIAKIQKNWTSQARLLRGIHVSLVVVATVASVLVAASVGTTPWRGINLHAVLAAVSAMAIGLVSAFELGNKANNFRNAWRLLEAATRRPRPARPSARR